MKEAGKSTLGMCVTVAAIAVVAAPVLYALSAGTVMI